MITEKRQMETKYFEHLGGRIAYDDVGSGPLIVCVPGMGDVRGQFRYLAPELVGAGFRVVTMDVRGHGETSVDWPDYSVQAIGADIIALIRHLEAGPAIVVGNSMAGAAAIWAEVEASGLIAGLVLICPVVRDGAPAWQAKALYSVLLAAPWGVAAWNKYYQTLFKKTRPADFEDYRARLMANLRRPGRLRALRRMAMAPKAAAAARLTRMSAPALLVMGTADPDFKDASAEARAVGEMIGARVELIEGAGHYPHVELPTQTNPIIVSFARELEERRRHAT